VNETAAGHGVDRLRLLASAMAGRALEVAAAGAAEPAWTDGTTVFVPSGAGPVDQLRMVAVQSSLLAAGSLDPAVLRGLGRRSEVARRYLAVEGHRALVANHDVLPPAVGAIARPAVAISVDSAGASLATARGRGKLADPPAWFGVIRPRRLLAAADRAAADSAVADRADAAPGAPGHVRSASHDDVRPEPVDHPDDDLQSVGRLLSSPVGGRGVLGRLLQRMLRPIRDPAEGGPAHADGPAYAGRVPSHHSATATSPGRGARAFDPAALDPGTVFEPSAWVYPEWDVHSARYRPDWCTVHEREPRTGEPAPMAIPGGRALRRPLARLGTALDPAHRQLQGDDIDIDAAVEGWVNTAAGSAPDEAVYLTRLPRRRDLAVLVLLDVSGSAREPGPSGRTVHEHQRSTATAVTSALHALGDRVAVYAFNSQGRHAVHITRVKSFDDRLDARVARRLGGLVPGAYTRLGAAIRHAAGELERRGGTTRRLLLVISDGFAYDHGYEARYGEADARRALAEARRRGLGCLCLSVGSGTEPAALQRVFGTAAHATVATTDELAVVIAPLMRSALRSAEAQRRVSQRTARTAGQLALERRAP
jgi:nitric oxide reductase NorD protein